LAGTPRRRTDASPEGFRNAALDLKLQVGLAQVAVHVIDQAGGPDFQNDPFSRGLPQQIHAPERVGVERGRASYFASPDSSKGGLLDDVEIGDKLAQRRTCEEHGAECVGSWNK